MQDKATAEVTLTAQPIGPIDPMIYGANYVWHLTPAGEFDRFARSMEELGASIIRYPGGWAAERYDWADNRYDLGSAQDDGSHELGQHPGVGPSRFLSRIGQVSFVVPSAPAIRDPAMIGPTAQDAQQLVRLYGGRVKVWELGNEWWLQRAAKNNPSIRSANLAHYAALARAAAPAMKAADRSIRIYLTGDWTRPEEFAELRALVGERVWGMVDGVSIHPYCGDTDPDTWCSRLPERAARIRSLTGKTSIYASEWSLGRKVTKEDFGIHSASLMILAIRHLVEAQIHSAAYWPAVRGAKEIALVDDDYGRLFAPGLLFREMALYYRGSALTTSGAPSAAARSAEGVSVFVATMDCRCRAVTIRIPAMPISRVVSAEVLSSARPDDPLGSRVASWRPLPTRLWVERGGTVVIQGDLARASPDRNGAWQIARVTAR
jgi:hypothetical protein